MKTKQNEVECGECGYPTIPDPMGLTSVCRCKNPLKFEKWIQEQNKAHKSLYGFEMLGSRVENIKEGWDACKLEILQTLNNPIQNCDLSWEYCDERFIEKIKNL